MAESTTADWIIEQSRRHPLLTPEEEITLAREVQAWMALKDKPNPTAKERMIIRRGKRAYDRFFLSNIRLVVCMANRYVKRGGNLLQEDLIQEGILGLQRAIQKYDPTRGYKFSTYAFSWIRQSISRGINTKGKTIRIPEHAYRTLRKASEFAVNYELEHHVKPPISLIAEASGCQTDTLKSFLRHSSPVISLDEKAQAAPSRNGMTYLELIADEVPEASITDELDGTVAAIFEVFSQLTDTQREVITRRYLQPDPETFRTIAEDHGVSRERIRQVHDKTINIMRHRLSCLGHTRASVA